MNRYRLPQTCALIFVLCCFMSCSSESSDSIELTEVEEIIEDDNTDPEEENDLIPKTTYDITSILSALTAGEDMSYEIVGEEVYIYSTGVPDHNSPYFIDTEWEDEKYEDNDDETFFLNPNRIDSQEYEFRIPLHPTVATEITETSMGAMGVTINGVPLFNQYAAGGVDLGDEFRSFDQYSGHPTGTSAYHYHVEPIYLTEQHGADALIGVLLDGFPVYGPEEDGTVLDSDDLDDYHGHFGATKEFSEGIYHYHTTADAPYINGNGFYGVPGTVSN